MEDQQTESGVVTSAVQPTKNKWTKKRKIITIVLAIMILLVAIISVLTYVYKDRLVIMTKEPYQKVILSVPICGDDIVKEYNDVYQKPITDANDVADQKRLFNDLSEAIRGKAHYEQDPTCQTILFWVSFFNNDTDSMQNACSEIRNLYNQGFYSNSDIASFMPLSGMEQAIGEISSLINLEE